jgi:hypothetical protein
MLSFPNKVNSIQFNPIQFCVCVCVCVQTQFIHLVKSLYDMFVDNEAEQLLYHSIAKVATLLLELGDVGKQFLRPSDSSASETSPYGSPSPLSTSPSTHGAGSEPPGQASASSTSRISHSASLDSQGEVFLASSPLGDKEGGEAVKGDGGDVEESKSGEGSAAKDQLSEEFPASGKTTPGDQSNKTKQTASGGEKTDGESRDATGRVRTVSGSQTSEAAASASKPDELWSIRFEQFLASMLTEEPLVAYFERVYDVTDTIAAVRNRRLVNTRQSVG